jgi:hypothetical protein
MEESFTPRLRCLILGAQGSTRLAARPVTTHAGAAAHILEHGRLREIAFSWAGTRDPRLEGKIGDEDYFDLSKL